MTRVLVGLAALVFAAVCAPAQPKDGDFLVGVIGGTSKNLLYVDRMTGNISSITTIAVQPTGFTNAVLMAKNNTDIIAIDSAANSLIARPRAGVPGEASARAFRSTRGSDG